MNDTLTEIAFVLDRSGSMESTADAAIAGFNGFLQDQRNAPGAARLTLVLFDDQYLVPCASIPIAEVVGLDRQTYVPRGGTALLDAIGKTISDLGKTLAAIPEAHRPGQVVVAILTDGHENASVDFTWRDIAKMIRHQESAYSWEFLFLGANQDAIATAAGLGIAERNASAYIADANGQQAGSKAISRKMSAYRARSIDPEAAAESRRPLADIVREEDGRGA